MLNKVLHSGIRWLWVAIFVIALDQWSKSWVVAHLELYEPLAILPFFNLTLAHNTGAAFSFLDSAGGWQHVFFITLALIVAVTILHWLSTLPATDRLMSVALSLVLGGALGNVWDRFHYQYVVDFLDFHLNTWHFAIFNVADAAITVGAVLMVFAWLRKPN